jgi:DNA-binding GntR family transcriptional regulator
MKLELTTLQFVERIANWSNGTGPLYRRLAEKIKLAIRQGEILAETRLPPERRLAQALAVSRSTIVAAYELLRAEGWL